MLTARQFTKLRVALQHGLPICEHPYSALAKDLNISEETLLKAIAELQNQGLIKRFGMVVRHHELGYRANAMVVWDVPDDIVDEVGDRIGRAPQVTLSYRRPRRLPDWPFNLFCMIHGKDRNQVRSEIDDLIQCQQLSQYPCRVLFSTRRFKQQGADYVGTSQAATAACNLN